MWSTATHVGCRYFHKTAMGILPCRPKLRIVKFLSSSRNLLNQRFQKNVCMFVWTWENELKRFIISYHIGYYAEMKDFNFHGQNFWVTYIPDRWFEIMKCTWYVTKENHLSKKKEKRLIKGKRKEREIICYSFIWK